MYETYTLFVDAVGGPSTLLVLLELVWDLRFSSDGAVLLGNFLPPKPGEGPGLTGVLFWVDEADLNMKFHFI